MPASYTQRSHSLNNANIHIILQNRNFFSPHPHFPLKHRQKAPPSPRLPYGPSTDPVRPFFSSSSVVFQCCTEKLLKKYR